MLLILLSLIITQLENSRNKSVVSRPESWKQDTWETLGCLFLR